MGPLHPRETKLCYLHLPLWLFGIKIKSLSVLKCTFHPCDFWLDFSRSILSSFPYSKNYSGTEESDTSFALFVLTRANCDQLIPFPFSAKNKLPPSIALLPAATKSPHKKTVYQSRQSRRVL